MTAAKTNRKLHRLGAIVTAVPVLVIFLSGFVLQLKKEWSWVQPPTQRGSVQSPQVPFDDILVAAMAVPEAQIKDWGDVDRLDVRPGKGVVKVRAKNRWEVQIDLGTASVLSSSYRRSDLIESIHDGSWFHDSVKLWLFLPTATLLVALWFTGIYLWFLPYLVRRRRKQRIA